jgi:hypothetical protein
MSERGRGPEGPRRGIGGDPLMRRAAAELRREGRDPAAVAAIVAAVRRQAAEAAEGKDAGALGVPGVPGTGAGAPGTRDTGAKVIPIARRRALSLSPLAALAAAVLVFATGLGVGASLLRPRGSAESTVAATNESPAQRVEFVLVAPRASRVALVGEFNGWDASATPMRLTNDRGTWSVSVPLSPGRHVYSFVVDDSTWVPDPQAPLSPERWFGERNSVIVVSEAPRT